MESEKQFFAIRYIIQFGLNRQKINAIVYLKKVELKQKEGERQGLLSKEQYGEEIWKDSFQRGEKC